ncbi:MAG: MBL fold metallo-hydrolase [Ruminococcaceae bacterium]|nr:MBL fold metallo-hydrolase [Oscillospiraceae bacterium]
MKNKRAQLHVLTEYSQYSMGFVIITPEDRAIIIDGGRSQELPNVAAHVGDRPVAAWILTHPHSDHINCINHALKHKHPLIERTEKFIYHFHDLDFYSQYAKEGERQPYLDFLEWSGGIQDRVLHPVTGDEIEIDGLRIEFLFHKDERFTSNVPNDSSLVFRVHGRKQNILFLGDLGPIAGRELLRRHGDYLQSDVVQMAHHGHMCVEKDVYEAIDPRACIWCCQAWLYRENDRLILPDMYGVAMTRRWMEEIGVTEHYVTKDGDQIIAF